MGTRKELLCLHDSEPIYMHLVSILHAANPEADAIYMSLRDRTALEDICASPAVSKSSADVLVLGRGESTRKSPLNVRIIYDYDEDAHEDMTDIGPAAGLLAAHRADPAATWLVAACDYPLLTAAALRQLRDEASGEVTCFQNGDGFYEPLLGIWAPGALRELQRNVQKGILGPRHVVKQHQVRPIRPRDESWLFNVNTPEEWRRAVELKRKEVPPHESLE
jgi:molybdopterin-guanine dinucleotide biosynthesis protein A